MADSEGSRFVMPQLTVQVEGRGNGLKTVLVNGYDIGRALHRSGPEIAKFIGMELGSKSHCDDTSERLTINRSHQVDDLQRLLVKYVENFVICPSCAQLDTTYCVEEKTIRLSCEHCGVRDLVDPTHELIRTIRSALLKAGPKPMPELSAKGYKFNCVHCLTSCELTAEQVLFYKSKMFVLPKRCRKCIAKHKSKIYGIP